ncbi:TPA: glycerol dehydratase reactivase beta/small subunit family protein [Streptococcus suis]|nr:glycerol dehydratase reactivase beta/small subunit family protein [Streptococcus suis]
MFYQTTKPVILIYKLGEVELEKLTQVELGMEEEGIPFLTEELTTTSESIVSLAHQAAQSSPLSVGLAINDQEIVLHYRNLQKEQFFYRLRNYSGQTNQVLRILGTNAAKLVKGTPLIAHVALESSF